MARPRQTLLTRQRIVDAASALVDAEGLEALSMRRLATELGVQGPSLYNHFPTKADILDAVADGLISRVSHHAVLVAHPNVVPVLAHGPGRRPAALAMADVVYGALIEAGWPPARATHIGALMRYLVTGSALGSFALGFHIDPALYERYPHLQAAPRLAAHHVAVDEGAFELGLDLLINGLLSQKGLVDDVRA
jgi:AcrR family transcriptional regulator